VGRLKKREWLEKEMKTWVDQEIITPDQQSMILSNYPEREHGIRWLPLLAGILVGAGVLSFIASNWQDVPVGLKLVLIFGSLIGTTVVGERLIRRGSGITGLAFIIVATILFGGGIFLIGQIYHLISYHSGAFYIWFASTILMAYVYRSKVLYLLSIIILNIAGYYSLIQFDYHSLMFYVMSLGAFPFVIFRKAGWISVILYLSLAVYSTVGIFAEDGEFTRMLLYGGLLLVLSDSLPLIPKSARMAAVTSKIFGYVFGLLFALIMIYDLGDSFFFNFEDDGFWVEVILLSILFSLSICIRYFRKDWENLTDWIMFIPVFLMEKYVDWLYILLIFAFSIALFISGSPKNSYRLNVGTAFFMIATIVGYSHFAWDFLPKSLFFTLGGIVLFLVSFFLNRKRKAYIQSEGGESHE
jgi:uncharacterized membrane protein